MFKKYQYQHEQQQQHHHHGRSDQHEVVLVDFPGFPVFAQRWCQSLTTLNVQVKYGCIWSLSLRRQNLLTCPDGVGISTSTFSAVSWSLKMRCSFRNPATQQSLLQLLWFGQILCCGLLTLELAPALCIILPMNSICCPLPSEVLLGQLPFEAMYFWW